MAMGTTLIRSHDHSRCTTALRSELPSFLPLGRRTRSGCHWRKAGILWYRSSAHMSVDVFQSPCIVDTRCLSREFRYGTNKYSITPTFAVVGMYGTPVQSPYGTTRIEYIRVTLRHCFCWVLISRSTGRIISGIRYRDGCLPEV